MAVAKTALQTGLAGWLWRLIPANPILVRVVSGASRRRRHLLLRIGYLAVLTVTVLSASIGIQGMEGSGNLAKMAKASTRAFATVSYVQLALVCFLAPVFTAGAITQERDNQTYNILIATPLSNAQIVLGSLLSRLYFLVVLMASGVPIFCITMIYGGVTTHEIMVSFLVASCTALLTGAVAIATSVVRVGSRRTIFSFYLVIVVYLLGIYFLSSKFPTPGRGAAGAVARTKLGSSYLSPLHPFLCLQVAMNVRHAPEPTDVSFLPWPIDNAVAHPYQGYLILTFAASLVLIVFSMFFVRRGIREGELSIWTRLWHRFRPPVIGGVRRRRPRTVWANPVAWREAATRAATARSGVHWVYVCGGTAAAIALTIAAFSRPAVVNDYLMGVVLVEFGVVLLVATNLAAGSLTREYEANTIDLLLTTPLTSRYIVWGKLRGLVSAVLPLIAVPSLTMLGLTVAHAVGAAFRSKVSRPIWPEAWLEAAILMIAHVSWACMLGMNRSLFATRTVSAVMQSVGLLIVICGLLFGVCSKIVPGMWLGPVGAALSPLVGLGLLSDPETFIPGKLIPGSPAELRVRMMAMIGVLLAAGMILLLVSQWYRSMVKNFDMIVRKKSR